MIEELKYNELKNNFDIGCLKFQTTAQVDAYYGIIGQERAVKALDFGFNVKSKGYNIYVSGIPGTGKTTFAKSYAEKIAAKEETPNDLCYIYNFKNPKCPKVLSLPPGWGVVLKEELEELINRFLTELPKVFGSKDFESSKYDIVKGFQIKRDEIIKEMTEEAKSQNFGVKSTNTGIYFMPIVEGEVISEEQFEALSQEEKDKISQNSEVIQKYAQDAMRSIKEFEKATRSEVESLEYSIGLFTVGYHMSRLLEKYQDNEEIVSYLLAVKEDILNNISDFMETESSEEDSIAGILPWYQKKSQDDGMSKYKINVITDNTNQKGAPVIVDFNPTYTNLIGEIEYDNEFGNLTTDFMKIKPGLLHKANGGYLILQAYDVLTNPHAWETLRRVLLTGEIVIDTMREFSTGVLVSGIKPEPIKTNIKLILVGTGFYYDLLYSYDDQFQKLFKILAQFDYEIPCNEKYVGEIVTFIKAFVKKEQTAEFDYKAVAAIIEFSSRLAERQDKLTAQFSQITEILVQAATWAKMDNAEVITDVYVRKAIDEREFRLNMYEEKLSQMIEEDIIMIDTAGEKVGQINGLAVLDYGDYAFAKPSRITTTTYLGKAGIINIEKEAELSGSIHDKGISVLCGYLGQTYAQEFPLTLSCRVCFEQTYYGIDGDSASSTELFAILSSLANAPIKQGIAVTGSINQRGEIQPIGGVTYKIEGFFDLCQKRGLTGTQGVIIPQKNVKDLVLKDNVIEAVKDGMFHIYPITHVDQGIEILTGIPAGTPNEKGKYDANSIHGRVMKRLKEFHKKSIDE